MAWLHTVYTCRSSHALTCFSRGVHLKDLILLHTALPDRVDSNLINFRKMAQLSNIFTHLMQVQNALLPFEANIDLVNTIRVSGMSSYSLNGRENYEGSGTRRRGADIDLETHTV